MIVLHSHVSLSMGMSDRFHIFRAKTAHYYAPSLKKSSGSPKNCINASRLKSYNLIVSPCMFIIVDDIIILIHYPQLFSKKCLCKLVHWLSSCIMTALSFMFCQRAAGCAGHCSHRCNRRFLYKLADKPDITVREIISAARYIKVS